MPSTHTREADVPKILTVPRVEPRGPTGREKTDWTALIDRLLGALVLGTDSDVAVVRMEHRTGTRIKLILRHTKYKDPSLERFHLPKEKDPACYGGSDVFETWGVISFSSGAKRGGSLPECGWVQEKAWFPVMLDDDTINLVILLRSNPLPYVLSHTSDAWFMAQKFVSRRLKSQLHQRFSNVVDTLNLLFEAPDPSVLLQTICHCLTSQRGLNWDRVWIFEEDRQERVFECRACRGEVDKERKVRQDKRSFDRFARIEDEIAAVTRRESAKDSLASCCMDPELFTALRISPNDMDRLFPSERGPEVCRRLLEPLLPGTEFKRIAQDFESMVSLCASRHTYEYQPDRKLFCFPVRVKNRRYIVVLSQAYGKRSPSKLLTSVLMRHIARVIGEIEDSVAASKGRRSKDKEKLLWSK